MNTAIKLIFNGFFFNKVLVSRARDPLNNTYSLLKSTSKKKKPKCRRGQNHHCPNAQLVEVRINFTFLLGRCWNLKKNKIVT